MPIHLGLLIKSKVSHCKDKAPAPQPDGPFQGALRTPCSYTVAPLLDQSNSAYPIYLTFLVAENPIASSLPAVMNRFPEVI